MRATTVSEPSRSPFVAPGRLQEPVGVALRGDHHRERAEACSPISSMTWRRRRGADGGAYQTSSPKGIAAHLRPRTSGPWPEGMRRPAAVAPTQTRRAARYRGGAMKKGDWRGKERRSPSRRAPARRIRARRQEGAAHLSGPQERANASRTFAVGGVDAGGWNHGGPLSPKGGAASPRHLALSVEHLPPTASFDTLEVRLRSCRAPPKRKEGRL